MQNHPSQVHMEMRQKATAILQKAIEAVDPGSAIRNCCNISKSILRIKEQRFNLARFSRVFIIGGGKAAASMARAMENILRDHLTDGAVTVKYDHTLPSSKKEKNEKIHITEAAHPVPDSNGLHGSEQIMNLVSHADADTLIMCLISGGASALMPLPAGDITLKEKQATTRLLLRCGATIHEINTIRKHLSRIKGGQLTKAAHPATVVTLILSDVVGDDLDIIGSGPTVADRSTFGNCMEILHKYKLTHTVPTGVLKHFEKGVAGTIPETPKPGDPLFNNTWNMIIGNNFGALSSASRAAEEMGYTPLILSSTITGETRDVALVHAAIAKEVLKTGNPVKPPACLLSGGETTVTLQDAYIEGVSLGGRNQEFALAFAMEIGQDQEEKKNFQNHQKDKKRKSGTIVLISAGTDGSDGPTDAAGAMVDTGTLQKALHMGLDPQHYLKHNDAYHFFDKLDNLIKTGPTHTNVMDIRIILIQ